MKLIKQLEHILNEKTYKAMCDFRTEQKLIDLLFADMQDPEPQKTEGNTTTYRWEYEFAGYNCKDGTPHLITFEWQEKYNEEDESSTMITLPRAI